MTNHKGVFAYFWADKFFDTSEIDESYFLQRRLDMRKRDTVEKYVEKLEVLYDHHKIFQRVVNIDNKLLKLIHHTTEML